MKNYECFYCDKNSKCLGKIFEEKSSFKWQFFLNEVLSILNNNLKTI